MIVATPGQWRSWGWMTARVFNVLAASFCWERDIVTLRDITWQMTDRWRLSSVLSIMDLRWNTAHANCIQTVLKSLRGSWQSIYDVYFSDSKWRRVMAEPLQIDVMLKVKNWRIETFYSNAYWGSIVTFVRRNWQVKFGSDQRESPPAPGLASYLVFTLYTLFVRVRAAESLASGTQGLLINSVHAFCLISK